MSQDVVGSAVVVIGADASRFRDNLAAQLVAPIIQKSAQAAGKIMSVGFSKGFARLEAIDTAQGKLRGLGHDAESMQKIMQSALASVRGTAYGLGDAATIAATAVASGLKPGQELTDRLKLTGDAATIAGTSLSEMGSIFGKVQTGQKAYTAELNQMADRGIPIYQWLQDELGVSAEALRSMVSKGEVDSAMFFRVIQKNIGGAALESGKTFRGSLENVGAALSRLGAGLIGPAFQQMPAFFAGLIAAIEPLEPVMSRWGAVLGGIAERVLPAVIRGVEWLVGLLSGEIPNPFSGIDLTGLLDAVTRVREAFATAFAGSGITTEAINLQSVVDALTAGLVWLADNMGLVVGAAGVLTVAIVALSGATSAANTVNSAFGADSAWRTAALFSLAAANFANAMATRAATAATVQDTVATRASLFAKATDLAATIGRTAAHWASVAAMTAVRVATLAWTGVQWLLNAALAANPIGLVVLAIAALVAGLVYAWKNSETFRRIVIGAWEGLKAGVAAVVGWFTGSVVPWLQGVWDGIVAGVQWFVDFVVGLFLRFHPAGLIISHWETITEFFSGLWAGIVGIFSSFGEWVANVWGAFWSSTIGRLITLPFELGFKIIAAITILIGRALMWLVEWVGGVFAAGWGLVRTYLVQPVIDAVVALRPLLDGIVAGFNWVRDLVVAAVLWLAAQVVTAWNWLSAGVTAIVTAIVTWVVSRFNWWRDTIGAIAGAIRDWVVDRWNQLRAAVFSVVIGLVAEVVSRWTIFRDGVVAVAQTVRDWVVDRFEALRAGAVDLFQRMVDGIGRIWDGLKAIAKAPVKFVIETVLNRGLISGWNWVVDKLKLPKELRVADIPMPPGFIHGGVLPGGGVSTGDDLMVMDRQGRGVATVASGEPVLSRAMYAANRPIVDAILAGRHLPGFFQGGTLPTVGPVRPHGMPYYGARYAADMGLGAGSPVVAWMDGVVASIQRLSTSYGHNIRVNHGDRGQSLYAHLLPGSIAVAVGQAVRAGMRIASVGYTGNVRPAGPGGAHLHFEILGGNAPIGQGSADTGGGGLWSSAVGWIAERMTAPVRAMIDRIPGESFITDGAKGVANKLLDQAVTAITGKAPAGTDTGAAVPFVPGQSGTVPGLAGVTANTYAKAANIYAAALQAGHRASTVGGYRGDGEHVTRRALDFMVGNKAAGDWIANYAWSNRARFGLQHVIWWQRILSAGRAGEGWRAMADRGSFTQNHMDHPHVLFDPSDKLMDAGGWLRPGQRAVNLSGGAEPVLTSGQWGNVQGILSLLDRQQRTEQASKNGGVHISVEYKPTIDPHAVNPRREYERFSHDFVRDVEALLR